MPSRLQTLRQKLQPPEFDYPPPPTGTEKFGFLLGQAIARAFTQQPIICFGAVTTLIIWGLSSCNTPRQTAHYHKSAPPLQSSGPPLALEPLPHFKEPELPVPPHSEVRAFTGARRIAPFGIRTSSGGYYFIKLVDSVTGSEVLTIFVHGGLTAEVDVPLGSYEVRYASWSRWYGYNYLFGPETVYSKANEVFSFEAAGNQIRGYTVTLYKVAQGNLKTQKIRAEDF
jgi:hypothetical protein